MKKVIALVLTLVMVFSIASVTASATTGGSTNGTGVTTNGTGVTTPGTGSTTPGTGTTTPGTGSTTPGTGTTTPGTTPGGGSPIAPPSGGGSTPSTPDEGETPAANPFTDVSTSAYYYDAVQWLIAQGITEGKTETTFEPNSGCTRAQMVTFLWRASGKPGIKAISLTLAYKDVSQSAYYYPALQWATEQKLCSGTGFQTFSPDKVCTRAEMVTFLWRSAGKPLAANRSHSFEDVDKDAYYYEALLWAVEQGITFGTSETTFSPDEGCTRGQMMTFLYRFFAE